MFFLLFARDSRERIYPRVLYISQNQWEFYLIWRPHSYSIQSGRQHTHTQRERRKRSLGLWLLKLESGVKGSVCGGRADSGAFLLWDSLCLFQGKQVHRDTKKVGKGGKVRADSFFPPLSLEDFFLFGLQSLPRGTWMSIMIHVLTILCKKKKGLSSTLLLLAFSL